MTTPIPPNPPRWEPTTDPSSIEIPGLDTTASVNDQLDQIDQLITIKLQNIDANFSRIQHLMSTRLLPAIKRYAVNTEPVREAANFWTTFYEQAAQVRVPRYDEEYSSQEQVSESTAEPASEEEFSEQADVTPTRSRTYDPNVTASENSFMPGEGAVSSTPATMSRNRMVYSSEDSIISDTTDEQPSWAASLESPLVRIDRELQNFSKEDASRIPTASADTSQADDSLQPNDTFEEENTINQYPSKGKGKELSLLQDVLRQNAKGSAAPTPRAGSTKVSPLRLKQKTPVAKGVSAYTAPKSSEWTSMVASPRRQRYERSPRKQAPEPSTSASTLEIPSFTSPQKQTGDHFDSSFDDSADLMPQVSPPRTMQFARAPRSSMGLGILPQIGRTPGKEAADRIRKDLLGEVSRQQAFEPKEYKASFTDDTTMSSLPTPPSLARYRSNYLFGGDSAAGSSGDATFETMMKKAGLNVPLSAQSSLSTQQRSAISGGSSSSASRFGLASIAEPAHRALEPYPEEAVFQQQPQRVDTDSDSDSDSLDDDPTHHPGQPSSAFLMASSRPARDSLGSDDSFGSSNHSHDSLLDDDGDGGNQAVHPFARAAAAAEGGAQHGDDGFGFDDTFDDDDDGFDGHPDVPEEETVFGIPPAQRQVMAQRGQLRMLGEDLLQDTIGIGNQKARAGHVEESPTPWPRG
ncbi:hypothetical protein CONPUDRAFT_161830 [Coniophora puteana RWD-64-598 SS2]|uniref:DASH complex subunit ASK1 n=1 Tax=Coniophora puteana (strain RWD-64-598) TaxID=741705 RepID=A0A5M3N7F5_CONPW|nr:uncharacterized protein CONPUDRAFT_161830 [Coniophora puteana RWD-64-598 SS2]EIW87246.1 hypothetical protein CONPUDRAFT_161830 [Coniophora puteana RWD-64-598 SS2]